MDKPEMAAAFTALPALFFHGSYIHSLSHAIQHHFPDIPIHSS